MSETVKMGENDIVKIIVLVLTVIMAFVFVYAIVRYLYKTAQDRHSPRLTVQATVQSKRKMIVVRNNSDLFFNPFRYEVPFYYLTFQFSGDKTVELPVSQREFDLYNEGDEGRLTYKGSEFCGFEQNKKPWEYE